MKNLLIRQITLLLLIPAGLSHADIGLIHITGRPAVVYEENGKVIYRRCSKDDLEVNRNCRSIDEEVYSLSRTDFFDHLAMMAGLPADVRSMESLPQISTRLLRTEQLVSEAKDLPPEDLTQAASTIEELKKQQRRLVVLQHRVMDFLETKQSKVLDAVIRLKEYEEVFFALFPQVVSEYRPTGRIYHIRYHESDIDNYAIKDQCKGGWRFLTQEEAMINQKVIRTHLGSVLLHDYPMGNYGVAKGLVWTSEGEGKPFSRVAALGRPAKPYQDSYQTAVVDGRLVYLPTHDGHMDNLRGEKNMPASVVCIRDFAKDLPFWEGK